MTMTGDDAPRGKTFEGVDLPVLGNVSETSSVRTLQLDNAEGRVAPHRAGQHVKVRVEGPDGPVVRAFTLSSPPTRPDVLELTVKRNPDGIASRALHALRAGDRLAVSAPSGRFVFDPETHRESLVLVVAGRGVTPAISILRTIGDLGLDRSATLFQGCRTPDDLLFANELDRMAGAYPRLRVVATSSRPSAGWTGEVGRVGPALLDRYLTAIRASRFFLCGPGEMNGSIAAWLADRGVPADRIHVEMFGKADRRKAVEMVG